MLKVVNIVLSKEGERKNMLWSNYYLHLSVIAVLEYLVQNTRSIFLLFSS